MKAKRVLMEKVSNRLSMGNILWFCALIIWAFLLIDFPRSMARIFISNLVQNLMVYNMLTEETLLLLSLFLFFFVSLSVLLYVRFVERRPISTLGFFKKDWLKELLKGWGLGMLLFSIILGILILGGAVQFSGLDLTFGTVSFVLVTIPFWLLQGGTEELVTRGWLFPHLTRRSTIPIGIIVSSLFFAAMHLSNPSVTPLAVVNLFLFAVFACLYFLKTDNIWGIAGLHGAWNFIQGNIYGIMVSGISASKSLSYFSVLQSSPSWLSGGDFGLEASIVTSLVLLLASLWLAIQLRKE